MKKMTVQVVTRGGTTGAENMAEAAREAILMAGMTEAEIQQHRFIETGDAQGTVALVQGRMEMPEALLTTRAVLSRMPVEGTEGSEE